MNNYPMKFRSLRRLAKSTSATTTPETAILIFAVAALLLVVIAPFGDQIKDSFGEFSMNNEAEQALASTGPTVDLSTPSRPPRFSLRPSEPVDQGPPMLLAIATVISAWGFFRTKSKKESSKPRPLQTDAQPTESQLIFDKRQQIWRVISNNRQLLLGGQLEVGHLATKDPVTITPNRSVEDACSIMEKQKLDHLLVCKPDGSLVGFVSKHYLGRTRHHRVSDAMTTKPRFVSPSAKLCPTVTHMLKEGVSCVAVVENGKAIGLLTSTDIQLTLQATLQIVAAIADENPLAEPGLQALAN